MTDITPRIQQALARIGMTHIPNDKNALLEQGGLDSLMLALLIIELEGEFHIKIPVMPLEKSHYESIASIEQHLIALGAQ